jgi:hypothetical protein
VFALSSQLELLPVVVVRSVSLFLGFLVFGFSNIDFEKPKVLFELVVESLWSNRAIRYSVCLRKRV